MSTETPKKARRSASTTIAFRVDADTNRRLREYAAASGMDLSDFLRELVRDRLDGLVPDATDHAELEDKIDALHRDLAISVRALLALLAVSKSPDQDPQARERAKRHATEWVRKNFELESWKENPHSD